MSNKFLGIIHSAITKYSVELEPKLERCLKTGINVNVSHLWTYSIKIPRLPDEKCLCSIWQFHWLPETLCDLLFDQWKYSDYFLDDRTMTSSSQKFLSLCEQCVTYQSLEHSHSSDRKYHIKHLGMPSFMANNKMTPPSEGLGSGIWPKKSSSGQDCQVKNGGPNFNYDIWAEFFLSRPKF